MGIKQLCNDNLRKLPNEYGDVSVMISNSNRDICILIRNMCILNRDICFYIQMQVSVFINRDLYFK